MIELFYGNESLAKVTNINFRLLACPSTTRGLRSTCEDFNPVYKREAEIVPFRMYS